MGTSANSADPAGISSWFSLFAKINRSSGTEIHHFIENFDQQPLRIQNGQFHTYCINMYGIIHQNEKG